jgi:7-cyano-7-deazaguanine synthase
MKKVIVCLLSGGIDSTVLATMLAQDTNNIVYLLSTTYGQGAETIEHSRSVEIGRWLKAHYPNVREHYWVSIGGESLWRKEQRPSFMSPSGERLPLKGFFGWHQPINGWPEVGYLSTRDEMLVLLAAAGLEARLHDYKEADSGEVALGFNQDDLTNFPDTDSTVYTELLTKALAVKDITRIEGKQMAITLPLIAMSKVAVIKKGLEIGAPLHLTWSCYYSEQQKPCQQCSQCSWRTAAFQELGVVDHSLTR